MRLLQPAPRYRSAREPDRFIQRAQDHPHRLRQPVDLQRRLIVQELVRQGKSVVDARNGGSSGASRWARSEGELQLTGYFNMPKVLEIALHNGVDPRTGKQLGPQTGDPAAFRTFDEFVRGYEAQLRHFIDIKVRGNNIIERLYAQYLPRHSCLCDR